MSNRFVDALAHATATLDESKRTMSRLADQMESVTNLVEVIIGIQERQRRTQKRLKLVTGGIVIGLALLLGLTVLAFYNASRISDLQARTDNDVLCPLYRLFIETQDRDGDGKVTQKEKDEAADSDRNGITTDAERKRYEHSFEVIFDGYDALNCKPGE